MIGKTMEVKKNIVVIVAHPDDETLWCGGTILLHPDCNWFVTCLCRKNDPDRALKFKKALIALNAKGIMGNLDDGAEQKPLDKKTFKTKICERNNSFLPNLYTIFFCSIISFSRLYIKCFIKWREIH